MKYNHVLFSLSFLLACSFMAHAMDRRPSFQFASPSKPEPISGFREDSLNPKKDEEEVVRETTTAPESYHVMIQEIVEILNQNHRPTQQEYSLHMDHPGMGGSPTKKVILWRRYGKKTDEALQFIRQFDWENGTRADAHKVYSADQLKKTTDFARYLLLANEKLNVEKQEVDKNGDLVTIFKRGVPLQVIAMIYQQVPGMGNDVETIPNSQEK